MAHRENCPCPVCRQGTGRSTVVLSVRMSRDLAEWLRGQPEPANSIIVRALERAREERD